MEVVVRSRGLPADRVIAVRNGFLTLYREYPNGRVEAVTAIPICNGAEDELIEVALKAFKRLRRRLGGAVEEGRRRA